MKLRIFLSSVFFFVVSFSCFSQIKWAVDGAEWHYSYKTKLYWLYVDGDTTIDGQSCRMIRRTEIDVNGTTDTTFLSTYYTYIEDSVVYKYQTGGFKPNWTFKKDFENGPQILYMDTCDLEEEDVNTCQNYEPTLTSIEHGEYNIGINSSEKFLYVQTSYLGDYIYSMDAFERIGGESYLFNYGICASSATTYILKCYSDPEVGFLQIDPFDDCDEVPVGISEQAPLQALKISPNPAQTQITLTNISDNIKSAVISNMLGKTFEVKFVTNQTLDISSLPNGAYFLQVHTANQQFGSKFVKQ